jgi:hypothetical protein
MGLLIAFTFSGAVSRFDARRQLIGQEANVGRGAERPKTRCGWGA